MKREPLEDLARRRPRERKRHDLLRFDAGGDERDEPLGQRLRLAGARRRLDQLVRIHSATSAPSDRRASWSASQSASTRFQVFRHVVWPQAFRVAIPALMNSVVALTKDTALVAVISVAEVIREAQAIISVTFEPSRYYFIVAVLFFLATFPLMKLSGALERRIKQKGYARD